VNSATADESAIPPNEPATQPFDLAQARDGGQAAGKPPTF